MACRGCVNKTSKGTKATRGSNKIVPTTVKKTGAGKSLPGINRVIVLNGVAYQINNR